MAAIGFLPRPPALFRSVCRSLVPLSCAACLRRSHTYRHSCRTPATALICHGLSCCNVPLSRCSRMTHGRGRARRPALVSVPLSLDVTFDCHSPQPLPGGNHCALNGTQWPPPAIGFHPLPPTLVLRASAWGANGARPRAIAPKAPRPESAFSV